MSIVLAPIDLRGGGQADLPLIDALMRAAFDPRFGEAWTLSQCAGIMAMPGVRLLIATIDEAPAGFALSRAIADEAELLLLAVHPDCRRRGVARSLLRGVIADCESRGIGALHLEVRAGNEAVILYRSAGFEKIGERRAYYRGPNGKLFDALTFHRKL